MQRRGDEALLGQTPEGIEAAAAGKLDGFGIAEGDVAGAVGIGGEEDLPVHLPQQAQKRLGGIRRLPVAAADRTGIDLEDLPCPDQPLHRGACAGRDDGIARVRLIELRDEVKMADDIDLRDLCQAGDERVVAVGLRRHVAAELHLRTLRQQLRAAVNGEDVPSGRAGK